MKYRTYETGSEGFTAVLLQELLELGIAGEITFNSRARMSKKIIYLCDRDAQILIDALRASGKTFENTWHTSPKILKFNRYDQEHGFALQVKFNTNKAKLDLLSSKRFYLKSAIARINTAIEYTNQSDPVCLRLHSIAKTLEDIASDKQGAP